MTFDVNFKLQKSRKIMGSLMPAALVRIFIKWRVIDLLSLCIYWVFLTLSSVIVFIFFCWKQYLTVWTVQILKFTIFKAKSLNPVWIMMSWLLFMPSQLSIPSISLITLWTWPRMTLLVQNFRKITKAVLKTPENRVFEVKRFVLLEKGVAFEHFSINKSW